MAVKTADLRHEGGLRFVARTGSGFEIAMDNETGGTAAAADRGPGRGDRRLHRRWTSSASSRRSARSSAATPSGSKADHAIAHPHAFRRIEITHELEGPAIDVEAVRRAIELSATKYCSVSAGLASGIAEVHHRYAVISPEGAAPVEAKPPSPAPATSCRRTWRRAGACDGSSRVGAGPRPRPRRSGRRPARGLWRSLLHDYALPMYSHACHDEPGAPARPARPPRTRAAARERPGRPPARRRPRARERGDPGDRFGSRRGAGPCPFPAGSATISRGARIRVAIVGATGYVGAELVRLLTPPPERRDRGPGRPRPQPRADRRDAHPPRPDRAPRRRDRARGRRRLPRPAPRRRRRDRARTSPRRGAALIDLGPDFRLRDPADYPRWYGFDHPAPGPAGAAPSTACPSSTATSCARCATRDRRSSARRAATRRRRS